MPSGGTGVGPLRWPDVAAGDVSLLARTERLWRAYAQEGPEACLQLLPPDIVVKPVQGPRLRGIAEVSGHLRQRKLAGGVPELTAYRFEESGDCVLVAGTMRRFSRSGFSDSQPAWIFRYEDGELKDIVGYATPAAARDALYGTPGCAPAA